MSIDLDAIRARLAATTPGPWTKGVHSIDERVIFAGREVLTYDEGGHTEDDADFIAHAPDDITALLAEVDRLRAAETRVRAVHDADRCIPCRDASMTTHSIRPMYCPTLRALDDAR